MSKNQTFIGTFKIEDGRTLQAVFTDQNDKDGFEISLGMYRANLGLVSEEVFLRFMHKFNGSQMTGASEGGEQA